MKRALRRAMPSVGMSVVFLLVATAVHAAETGAEAVEHGITHRMMMLAIQVGVILFAAKLSRVLFEHWCLPGVLGELAAGMAIGPYLLGAVALPGFAEGLFPPGHGFPVSVELYGLCSVAAIVLLFVVGLETDLKLFLRYSVAGSAVGVGGMVVSFVLGDLTMVVLSGPLFGQARGMMDPACLFLGVLSTATSVGITARVLSEKRKLDSPEGVTILAGAVVDDVLGIIALAIVLGLLGASEATGRVDWGHIGAIAAKAVGIWLAATVIGLLASRKISVLLKWFGDRSAIAIMALGLALVLAGLFEKAGLAMIIGAYVMGLALSQTDVSHVVQEKLESIFDFLVPVFFCVMGMMVNFRDMGSFNIMAFGLIYSVVAVAAKMLGCAVPALFFNFNRLGALRIGTGMVPRGEVALIIAGIGLASGALPSDLFGVAIMMTILTTAVAPLLLVRLFARPDSGSRHEVAVQEDARETFAFPSIPTVNLLIGQLTGIFESEGFFVHALDHPHRHYHMRKDDVFISMSREGTDLIFNCDRRDVPMVHTAMYEAVGEFETMIRSLREPIDAKAIGMRLQDKAPAESARSLSLTRYMRPHWMLPRLKAETKEDAIDELLGVLRGSGLIADVEAARRALFVREESMPTGIQHGLAIPHAKTDAVSDLICAVGLKSEGLDFSSMDGQPSTIIVLELSPLEGAVPHLQFVATVSQKLDEATRKRLLAAKTPDQMYQIFAGAS